MPNDQRYQKSWWDLLFLAYYIIFFAFVRQTIIIYIARPLAKYFGLRRPEKINRFGEQTYALFYFTVFGAWGYVRSSLSFHASLMSTSVLCQVFQHTGTILPNSGKASAMYPLLLTLITHYTGYPHWDIKAEMKCYYLLQFSHWLQELLVVSFGLEKARKDHLELVVHHFVTLWLIGCDLYCFQTIASDILQVELFRKYDICWQCCLHEHGYTRLSSSCEFSLDCFEIVLILPQLSKLLHYIQWETTKIFSFILFFAVWSQVSHNIQPSIKSNKFLQIFPSLPQLLDFVVCLV